MEIVVNMSNCNISPAWNDFKRNDNALFVSEYPFINCPIGVMCRWVRIFMRSLLIPNIVLYMSLLCVFILLVSPLYLPSFKGKSLNSKFNTIFVNQCIILLCSV